MRLSSGESGPLPSADDCTLVAARRLKRGRSRRLGASLKPGLDMTIGLFAMRTGREGAWATKAEAQLACSAMQRTASFVIMLIRVPGRLALLPTHVESRWMDRTGKGWGRWTRVDEWPSGA